MSRNCSTWCRSLLVSFSTCYVGILGLEGVINCILGSNLPPKDKSSTPKVPFIRRFHCITSSICGRVAKCGSFLTAFQGIGISPQSMEQNKSVSG